MYWVILIIAGIFEVFWAVGLKYSEGFTRPLYNVITFICLLISFILLGISMRELPVGIAYAVWVGIGVIGTSIYGVMIFNEPNSIIKVISLGFIVAGLIGLKLSTQH